MSLTPGQRLGQYEVLSPLGAGGMGEVYRAKDTRLGRHVAIKVLPKHLQQDTEARSRFEREARAISSLNHPNILTIHDFGEQWVAGELRLTYYMVTELIEGETLREMLSKERDGKKLIGVLAQAADALAKAHSAGIVHRDLKPENIMITSDGYAKVLDFGLAKQLVSPAENVSQFPTMRYQTQEGLVLGTVGYVSPEQARGTAVDHRSDIFSFGCILYEALSGKRPFEAPGVVDTLHQVIHSRPAAVPEEVPREVKKVIDRCLAKNPEDRYASMKEVAEGLRESTKSFVVPPTPARRTKPRSSASRASSRLKSIAVLPFTNSSNDSEMDYLSDGLTESIIMNLSVVRSLKVMARSTVFTYKGRDVTPQQVGRELRVGSVVTGRVQRRGEELLVNIELVNARDGSQLWGDRYRRAFSDVLDLQEEIATHISDSLKVQLSAVERQRFARRQTKRSDAFELYLKGRYHANKRTSEGVRLAMDYFKQAIALDPKYARAYSGLSECYVILAGRALARPEEGYPLAEEAARMAINLDPSLGEAHASLASLQLHYHWNWKEAERSFVEAIRLNPSYPTAHHWYSVFLNVMGRHDEAVEEARAAVELDPLSRLLNVHLADVLFYAGRIDDAFEQTRRTLELDQNFFLAHLMLGRCYDAVGQHEIAIACYERAIEIEGRYPELLAAIAHAHADLGRKDQARKLLEEIEAIASVQFVSSRFFAEVHHALGEDETALEYVKRFLLERGELDQVLTSPRFAKLRENLGFHAALGEAGFPPR